MSELYLMERNGERMNVPASKKDAYEAEGWKVLKTPQENKTVVVQDQPVVELPPVSAETAEVEEEPKPTSRSRGKKG